MNKRRIAFYGGSFDPVHRGHLAIGESLIEMFRLDQFVFIPAFHAPHKPDRKPTSAIQRYAMLALATNDDPKMHVSTMEIELPEKPYTIDTLRRIKGRLPSDEIFFVMGADSWQDIRTWREWEQVLLAANHIVVSRPGFPIGIDHVTTTVRERIVDLRNSGLPEKLDSEADSIFITDAVNINISATRIRGSISEGSDGWRTELTEEVAKYVEKYDLYR